MRQFMFSAINTVIMLMFMSAFISKMAMLMNMRNHVCMHYSVVGMNNRMTMAMHMMLYYRIMDNKDRTYRHKD